MVIEQKMKILELTGGEAAHIFLVNLRPKTLNNMGSICKKNPAIGDSCFAGFAYFSLFLGTGRKGNTWMLLYLLIFCQSIWNLHLKILSRYPTDIQ